MAEQLPDILQFEAVQDCLSRMESSPSLESMIELSCLLEASAYKPGNVSPVASFPDCRYEDFVSSARVIAPILFLIVVAAVALFVIFSVLNGPNPLAGG